MIAPDENMYIMYFALYYKSGWASVICERINLSQA